MSEPITNETINKAIFERLVQLELDIEKIGAIAIITVNSEGVTPDIFYKPGGRMPLLAGLELAKADLIEMIKEDQKGQSPIVDRRS